MSTTNRIVLLGVAAAILVAAVVLLRPSDDEPTTGASTATATATPSPTPSPDPGPLLTSAEVTKLRVNKGDTVRFRARSSKPEEIHVHGYDLSKEVEPGKTASMSFKATIEGIFEIEFEQSGTQIAQLRVDR